MVVFLLWDDENVILLATWDSLKEASRWSWKSESAKECVTTHLPNELALKMDGAQACYPYLAVSVEVMR